MNIQLHPTREQIARWISAYVPEKDFFFMKEEDLSYFKNYLYETLVIPKDEFFNHASFRQIQFANSYEYWNISKEIEIVIVAQSDWIYKLEPKEIEMLLLLQVEVGRGLIVPTELIFDLTIIPKEHIVKKDKKLHVVLQHDMWNKLPVTAKEQFIKSYALEWDSWNSIEVPAETPAHLKKYANTFSTVSGANCLAATLYAISTSPIKQEWIIHEWIHQQTFIKGIEHAGYVKTNDEFQDGDVVTWVNEAGIIQHASYYLGNNLLFNKNGQTFFNPWKIVHWDELKDEWKRYSVQSYRKMD